MSMKQEILQNVGCVSGVGQSRTMDTGDSGIEESSTNVNDARESLSRDSNETQHCNTHLLDSSLEGMKGNMDAVSQQSQSNAHAETDVPKSRPKSTGRAMSQRNVTRRSSGTPGSHRSSNPPSRRSSFAASQPVSPYNRRPLFPNRSISAAYDTARGEDPFLVHRRSTQIFQTFESPQGGPSRVCLDDRRSLESPGLSNLAHVPSTVVTTEQGFAISPAEDANPNLQHQYENHVPATVIDWTLPSTRRLEYREIDKSCRGFRGIWRRLAPRWCRRNSRLSFFDGNSSDTGSVRRYRLDLPEVEKENSANCVEITEQEIELSLGKTRRKWSLGFKDWAGRS
ncbi:hypothetical protein MMC29_003311 [Sticta canariensis]|nr:hypothetical protein [Sticta canariensis]